MIVAPLLSFFSASLLQRSVLNKNFKYDEAKPIWQPSNTFTKLIIKKHPYAERRYRMENDDETTGLLDRI